MLDKLTDGWLIDNLRREALEVKICFATFCNQVMIFSGAVLALTFTFISVSTHPLAAYAPLPVILILMGVSRSGLHKYFTANRNAAYELHLSRTADEGYMKTIREDARWKHSMRVMDWEVALRAWRVVQPTLFRTVYVSPSATRLGGFLRKTKILSAVNWFVPCFYSYTREVKSLIKKYESQGETPVHSTSRDESRRGTPTRSGSRAEDYPWFLPGLLVQIADKTSDKRPVYHTGNYLENMLGILFYLQILMLVPLLIDSSRNCWPSGRTAILVVTFFLVALRQYRIGKRRMMLEVGFLSIHSSAIVWQAVAYAHHRALGELQGTYAHYTENLARIAAELAANVFHLHDWLREPTGAT